MSRWSRRGFLAAALAALAGAPTALPGCARREPDDLLDAAMLGWFEPDAVRGVGRKALARGAGWNEASALRDALLPHLGDAGNPADGRRALSEAVRQDFRAGRTLELEGWLVAETEARLYALAALGAGRPDL